MDGLLEKQQRQNLLIRILLHRACAIATIIIVAISIFLIDPKAHVALAVLAIMFVVEIYFLLGKYSRIRKEAPFKLAINLFELKLKHVGKEKEGDERSALEYPPLPLFLEAIVLTILCIISGGTNSPFLSLFAIFSVLGLYVLDRRNPLSAAVDIIVLCFCFLLISGGELLLVEYKAFFLSYLTTETLLESHPWIFLLIIVYSVAMSGIAFYNVARSYAEQKELPLRRPFRETQEFLNARKIRCQPYENKRVFVIGNKSSNPEGTLALLPYCSRPLTCPIREDDEKKSAEFPTTDGCQQCDSSCHIGKLFGLEGCKIAELKIIGSSHKTDDVVDDFCKNGRKLTHVIAVCCTSNLARYLKSGMNKHKDVTVIYTPLILGDRICVSSIDPTFDEKAKGSLPCTSFDSDALISYLQK